MQASCESNVTGGDSLSSHQVSKDLISKDPNIPNLESSNMPTLGRRNFLASIALAVGAVMLTGNVLAQEKSSARDNTNVNATKRQSEIVENSSASSAGTAPTTDASTAVASAAVQKFSWASFIAGNIIAVPSAIIIGAVSKGPGLSGGLLALSILTAEIGVAHFYNVELSKGIFTGALGMVAALYVSTFFSKKPTESSDKISSKEHQRRIAENLQRNRRGLQAIGSGEITLEKLQRDPHTRENIERLRKRLES